MIIKKIDVCELIKKAKTLLRECDPSYALLENYIREAEDMLPDIKGKLTSAQEEVYKKLEAAVGP